MTNILAFAKMYRGDDMLRDAYVGDTHVAHMWENLFTNPSFETASGTVEVRRNYAHRAAGMALGGAEQWRFVPQWAGGTGFAQSVTYGNTGSGIVGGPDTFARKEWTAVPGGTDALAIGWMFTDSTYAPVEPGSTYTVSYWTRHNNPSPGAPFANYNQINTSFYDASKVQVGSTTNGPDLGAEITDGQWRRESITFTVPAGCHWINVTRSQTLRNPFVGMYVDATGLLVEKSPVLRDYFDGSTSPDSDLTPSWVGTANASESILTGVGVARIAGVAGTIANAYQSSRWASSVAKSYRKIPGSTDSDLTGAMPDLIGKTVTLSAKYRLESDIASPFRLGLRYYGSATVEERIDLPTTAGVHEVSQTFVIPTDTTGPGVRLWRSLDDTAEAWLDDLMLVEGSYDPGYFDGDAPPKVRRNLCPYPTGLSGFQIDNQGTGGSASASVVPSGGPVDDGPFQRVEWSVASTGGSPYCSYGYNSKFTRVTPGQTYTFSVYARSSVEGGQLRFSITGHTNLTGAGWISVSNVTLTASAQWQRFTFTAVIPATVVTAQFIIEMMNTSMPIGATLDSALPLAEEGDTLNPFFDGNTSPDDRYLPAWEGTANASPSYLWDRRIWSGKPFWTATAHASTSKLWGAPA